MPDSRVQSDYKGHLLFIPALIPLLPIHLSSRLLIIWAATTLVYYLINFSQRIPFPKLLLMPICMLLFFVIALPFANNYANQNSYIERNLAWIFIPLAYWLLGVNHRKYWYKILFYFTCFYTPKLLYAHLITTRQLYAFKNIPVDSLTFYYRTYFENNCDLHPAYAALFSGLCIIYCVHYLLSTSNLNVFKKSVCLIVALLHFSSTLLLASRMALVATCIATIVLIFSKKEYIKQGLIVIAMFIITGVFFMQQIPLINSRMNEVSKEALKMPVGQTSNTLSIRTGIYSCAFTLLKKHWLLGVTPADLQSNLDSCYCNINAKDLVSGSYNTHNEYLNKWLSFGLAGIGLLVALLVIPLVKALKVKFILFACFIIMMSVVFLSENILSRQYGLFFFLIIYSPAITILNSEKIKQIQTKS